MVTKTCHTANSAPVATGNCLDVKITNACNANCAFVLRKAAIVRKSGRLRSWLWKRSTRMPRLSSFWGGRADAVHSSGGISGDDSSLEETYLYDHKWEHAQGWTP